MNQYIDGNMKLFQKEVSKVSEKKMESCCRIKDGNGRLALGEDKGWRIWKDYFEDLYNTDIQEQVAVQICTFDGIQRGSYFGGEPIESTELEVRVEKLKKE